MLLIILSIIGLLAPVLIFQWWMYRSYGASPSLMDRLFGDDGYTARWGRKHYNSLHKRKPGEAEKRKRETPQRLPPAEDMRPRIARLDDSGRDDDAPPVRLSELLEDDSKHTRQQ